MDSKNYDIVEPSAAAMIESLRAYGYSLNTAIADLIDNSISAQAKNIWVHMHWAGSKSWISILDDGTGMNEETLVNAMRPGSKNPLEERTDKDLGRFGLGLKTASFSQCRSLTVISKIKGETYHTRRWDLDYVGKHNQWRLLKSARPQSEDLILPVSELEHGTIVLLENLDRISKGQHKEDKSQQRKFLDRISSLEQHLAMVFHRYMEGRGALRIYLNGIGANNCITPWDPFLSTHTATQPQPPDSKSFKDGVVSMVGYVLPHKDMLGTTDHVAAAGPRGWNDQQGFYVYRNRRLLVPGSWLGLGGRGHGWTKEEHYKLARIRVDIPNSLDSSWQIDVKKSAAVPPPLTADWMENYASHVRGVARQVFSHRGKFGKHPEKIQVERLWKPGKRGGSQIYRIDRQNSLVKKILKDSCDLRSELETLLRLLEETVPVQQIWLDMAEHPERSNEPMGGLAEHDVLLLAHSVITSLAGIGRQPTYDTINYVCGMEAFSGFEDIIRAKHIGVK